MVRKRDKVVSVWVLKYFIMETRTMEVMKEGLRRGESAIWYVKRIL